MNETGQACIVCSQGVLFRSGEEGKIRTNLIKGIENLAGDIIEAVIALPSNLFWGTGIPACVLVLNKKKPAKRKDKILFIYGAKDFEDGKNRDKLREEDIKKIVSAFEKYEGVDKYCHVADLSELEENEFNLNVPRYVDISEPEEPIDIQEAYDELSGLESEQKALEKKVKDDLKELGIKL